ncbi:ChbG/HpnK family deacetylase, partial [Bosea sp. (in: a-proteobacteria)]|uniref:ChbG/HpnK family deacetylase n=1 Tax=Bosea sp. (in: a-proteobacteria) TaxID=1871050 RepID=UPI00273371AE
MASGFVLCADDFALTDGVSRSILALLEAGKLSAAGAMTNRPHWRTFAGAFRALADQADLGLHLNLTCAAPLGAMARL